MAEIAIFPHIFTTFAGERENDEPMNAKEVLFITGAMAPFVPETPQSLKARQLPQRMQEIGHHVRTFTPKWGIINERRNQLHEVIRLSGMNIIIDETDHPLIIKVASIPNARMQIYFIDNDDYFMKRSMELDPDGNEYDDNGERAVFYARGLLETVKKLRWVPQIIHCYGWITACVPFYIKKAYIDEPSFEHAKVVYSISRKSLQKDFGAQTLRNLPHRQANQEAFAPFAQNGFGQDDMQKLAIHYADALMIEDDDVSPDVLEYAKASGKPLLPYSPDYATDFAQPYCQFYEQLMDA